MKSEISEVRPENLSVSRYLTKREDGSQLRGPSENGVSFGFRRRYGVAGCSPQSSFHKRTISLSSYMWHAFLNLFIIYFPAPHSQP